MASILQFGPVTDCDKIASLLDKSSEFHHDLYYIVVRQVSPFWYTQGAEFIHEIIKIGEPYVYKIRWILAGEKVYSSYSDPSEARNLHTFIIIGMPHKIATRLHAGSMLSVETEDG